MDKNTKEEFDRLNRLFGSSSFGEDVNISEVLKSIPPAEKDTYARCGDKLGLNWLEIWMKSKGSNKFPDNCLENEPHLGVPISAMDLGQLRCRRDWLRRLSMALDKCIEDKEVRMRLPPDDHLVDHVLRELETIEPIWRPHAINLNVNYLQKTKQQHDKDWDPEIVNHVNMCLVVLREILKIALHDNNEGSEVEAMEARTSLRRAIVLCPNVSYVGKCTLFQKRLLELDILKDIQDVNVKYAGVDKRELVDSLELQMDEAPPPLKSDFERKIQIIKMAIEAELSLEKKAKEIVICPLWSLVRKLRNAGRSEAEGKKDVMDWKGPKLSLERDDVFWAEDSYDKGSKGYIKLLKEVQQSEDDPDKYLKQDPTPNTLLISNMDLDQLKAKKEWLTKLLIAIEILIRQKEIRERIPSKVEISKYIKEQLKSYHPYSHPILIKLNMDRLDEIIGKPNKWDPQVVSHMETCSSLMAELLEKANQHDTLKGRNKEAMEDHKNYYKEFILRPATTVPDLGNCILFVEDIRVKEEPLEEPEKKR